MLLFVIHMNVCMAYMKHDIQKCSLSLLLAEIFFFFSFVLEVLDVSAVKRWKGDEVRSINYDKQTCDFTELLIVTSGFENNSINNSKSFIKPN